MAEFVRSGVTYNVNRGYLVATTMQTQEAVFRILTARQILFLRLAT